MNRLFHRAASLFRRFHGYEPQSGDIVRIDATETALCVGEVVGIIYKTKEERKPFLHRFNKSARPLLYVSHDGKTAFIVKGRWKFTDRGFIG